jgi:hypothetical protein
VTLLLRFTVRHMTLMYCNLVGKFKNFLAVGSDSCVAFVAAFISLTLYVCSVGTSMNCSWQVIGLRNF